jgi:hypothetical protein
MKLLVREGEVRMLHIGIARSIINPPLTVPQGGWGAQSHIYPEGIEADFWTTALYLKDEQTTAVIIDLDINNLNPDQTDKIRDRVASALGIEKSSVRVSTTHTHAGPVLRFSYFREQQISINTYLEYLTEQTVGTALRASLEIKPAHAGAGYGKCYIGYNRRQRLDSGRMVTGYAKEGETDPTVCVLRFDNELGEPLASIVHFSCHPTMLGPSNRLASPEYPGVTKRIVEQLVGGTCIFLQGSAGDIGPGPEGFKDNMGAMKRIGTILGCEAAKILLDIPVQMTEDHFEDIVESGATLAMWRRKRKAKVDEALTVSSKIIQLPLQEMKPVEELRQIANEYQRKLLELNSIGAAINEIKAMTFQVKRANIMLQRSILYFGMPYADLEIHLIRLGEIVLIGLPVEPFSRIGVYIREHSPFAYTLLSGYSNGWVGYLPTEDEYARGGYEVETSPFSANAAEILIAEVLQILNDLEE